MTCRIILPISVFFFVITSAVYGQIDCPADDDLMARLHKHALLENLVFRPGAVPACPDESGEDMASSGIKDMVFMPPVSYDDIDYWQSIKESLGFGGLAVYTYVADDGVRPYRREPHRYFLACPASGPYRLLISLSVTMRHPLQWIGATGPQYIVHVMGELAADDEKKIAIPGGNLEVRRLHNMEDDNEQLFFVRGFQRDQVMKNLLTVANDLLFGDPCPFDFATAAVKHIAMTMIMPENCRDGCVDPRYSGDSATLFIVGHSMGGSAVQHIAHDYAQNPAEYGNIVMDSYSFNSYGTEHPGVDPNRNFSYCTENDFACESTMISGRHQPGTYVNYYPSNGSASGHSIASVQEQLCNCRRNIGLVDFDIVTQ